MQNYQELTDLEIIENLKICVADERRATILVLHLFREVDRRRLYAERGYSSLFEFTTQELKYSAAAAFRRIEAMRLVKELPEVESKVLDGSLSLSVVAQAQTFFRAQKKLAVPVGAQDKREVLKNLEGRSTRDAERELLKLSPKEVPAEKMRAVTDELTEVRFCLTTAEIAQIEKVKLLLSHINPAFSWAELMMELTERALKSPTSKPPKLPAPETANAVLRSVRRAVFVRDNFCCSFVDPLTRKNCGSKFQLQVDHKVPRAMGGTHELKNLRLLCRTHNLLAATHIFGEQQMQMYLKN